MSRRAAGLLCWIAVGISACVAEPRGFEAAQGEVLRGDLASALAILDGVPPADRSYAEARSTARAVERRVRVAQRLFGRGLDQRAQWEDAAAIESFRAALVVWPGLPGAEQLIEATESRQRALESRASSEELLVAKTSPVDIVSGSGESAEPGATPLLEPAEAEVHPPASAAGGGARALPQNDVDDVLSKCRDLLRTGGVDAALDLLEAMPDTVRQSAALRAMRTDVLHQRALLHYGAGELTAAAAVWSRLLLLAPKHELGRSFRDAVKVELDGVRSSITRER